jgi:4-hydroxybenzoate polyprenyltransferase
MVDLYRHGKFSVPLIWAILNIFLFIGIIFALFFNRSFVLSQVLILLLLPLLVVIIQSWRIKSFRYACELYVLFLFYGIARAASLLYLERGK